MQQRELLEQEQAEQEEETQEGSTAEASGETQINGTDDYDATSREIVRKRPRVGDPSRNTIPVQEEREPNKVRVTTPYLTKYERARVLGTRALQIRYINLTSAWFEH